MGLTHGLGRRRGSLEWPPPCDVFLSCRKRPEKKVSGRPHSSLGTLSECLNLLFETSLAVPAECWGPTLRVAWRTWKCLGLLFEWPHAVPQCSGAYSSRVAWRYGVHQPTVHGLELLREYLAGFQSTWRYLRWGGLGGWVLSLKILFSDGGGCGGWVKATLWGAFQLATKESIMPKTG